MLLNSYAKINLYLYIVGKDPRDNYHLLDSVFQEVSLKDEIELEPLQSSQDEITFENTKVEGMTTIHKAVRLFREKTGIPEHYRIRVKKNIPMGAGLGGGSSNAAAVLTGLSELHHLPLEDMVPIGAKVGSDVSFFFHGGLCRVGGKGEKIFPLNKKIEGAVFLIVYPNIHVSTAWAYSLITDYTSHTDLDDLLNSSRFNIDFLARLYYNKFQNFVFERNPDLSNAKGNLEKVLASTLSFMSGSGSSLVFVYPNSETAVDDQAVVRGRFGYPVFVCDPLYRK